MNYLQLCQRVRQECGISGTGPVTVVSQSGEMKRIVDWVATAWEEIQQEYPTWSWNWLRGTFTLPTVAGTDTYDYTDAGIVSRFAQWKPDTFSIYKASQGVAGEVELVYVPYENWRRVYEIGVPVQGFPQHVTVKPDLTLALGPVPDDVYTVTGDYVLTPQTLSANTDTPAMPEQFHMAIVYLAMMYYGRYEAAAEIYADAQIKYQQVLRRIAMNQLPELQLPEALV